MNFKGNMIMMMEKPQAPSRERERGQERKKKFISRTVKVKSANQQAVFIIHRFDV
jgi:hypothetical protein